MSFFSGKPREIRVFQGLLDVGKLLHLGQRLANVRNQLLLEPDLLVQRPRDAAAVRQGAKPRIRKQRRQPLGPRGGVLLLPLLLLQRILQEWFLSLFSLSSLFSYIFPYLLSLLPNY